MAERDDPVRLRDALLGLSSSPGLGQAREAAELWSRWNELVGPAIADHAEPTSLRDHVLRVRAESPAWATELEFLREEIRGRANRALGKDVVREVRVWTSPGRPARRPPPPESLPQASPRRGSGEPAEALERARRAWSERRQGGPGGAL